TMLRQRSVGRSASGGATTSRERVQPASARRTRKGKAKRRGTGLLLAGHRAPRKSLLPWRGRALSLAGTRGARDEKFFLSDGLGRLRPGRAGAWGDGPAAGSRARRAARRHAR